MIDYSGYYWQTGRIRLRRANQDDVEHKIAFEFMSYDRYLWNGEIEPPRSPDTQRKAFEAFVNDEAREDRPLLIVETVEGDYIGLLNIHTYSLRRGTFGMAIYIVPNQRKKGYATEALGLVAHYMFMECRMHKWESGYAEENAASAALHKRMGHIIEGVIRDNLFHAGEYRNEVCTGLLLDEFLAVRGSWRGCASPHAGGKGEG